MAWWGQAVDVFKSTTAKVTEKTKEVAERTKEQAIKAKEIAKQKLGTESSCLLSSYLYCVFAFDWLFGLCLSIFSYA